MTCGSSYFEAKDFLEWFSKVGNFQYRILIAGNHDRLFQDQLIAKDNLLKGFNNIIYLEDSMVNVEGIRIYGTPYQPEFRNWAFNLPRGGEELKAKWDAIPDDVDILLTHSPPRGCLDKVEEDVHTGCKMLRERVSQVKPVIHAFGHIHESAGKEEIDGITFVNAAVLDRKYKYVHEPIVVLK